MYKNPNTINMKKLFFLLACTVAFSLGTTLVTAQAAGNMDLTFNPNDKGFGQGRMANNIIEAVAIQGDDKIVIGGNFTNFNGKVINRIARLNTDGTLDNSFDVGTGANSHIYSMAIQADGKIIIVGDFTNYNGTSINRVARLNLDGTIDGSFHVGNGADGQVKSIAIQPDGKIIIGGSFQSYNYMAASRVARLNENGGLDNTFSVGTGANSFILSTSIQADGKIIIAGDFSSYNGTPIKRVARLNSNGTLDMTFAVGVGPSDWVLSTSILPNGKIMIGGFFNTYNGITVGRIARLHSDGSLDETFSVGTGADNGIFSISVQSDGKIMVGGWIKTFNGTETGGIARLNSNGTLDGTFLIGNGAFGIHATAIQTDGKIVIAGSFIMYNGTVVHRLARLNPNGMLDMPFLAAPGTGTNDVVSAIAIQADGKIIIGGDFTLYNGASVNRIVRLNTEGSIDATFSVGSGANGRVQSIGLQPDGKIIIAGGFTSYSGIAINYIARLNVDGTIDEDFAIGTGPNSWVQATVIQPDGKVVIGGQFTSFNGVGRNRFTRLNTDGTVDESFLIGTGVDINITSMALQTDGKIVIGGWFTSYNGTAINRLARVNANGTLDESFSIGEGPNTTVNSISIQSNGKIIVGGYFSAFNGLDKKFLVRLNTDGTLDNSFSLEDGLVWVKSTAIQADGKIIIGHYPGNGTVPKYLARLNSDGTLDDTFFVGAGADADVFSIAIQPDGKIVIGGNFTSYNGIGRNGIARVFSECNAPSIPNTISGNSTICSGTSNTYSIAAVVGATSYTWTLPSGWTGASTTNSITAAASATSGNISVTANNVCSSSAAQTLAIVVNIVPAQPGTITGNATLCSGTTTPRTYSIAAVSGAASYTWTLPSGWTGTSNTNSITTTASTNAGNISVIANNICGSSSAQTLAMTMNNLPAQPDTINGTSTICSGTSNTYSITAVAGATGYTWALPGGWTGTSTTNSITATASATIGNISVTANNSCGPSSPQTLAIMVNNVPAQPGTINGTSVICSGTSNTYSIASVDGATSYTWTLPSGWTATSTANSIITTASSTAGNIAVTANNVCGPSSVRTLAITVNNIPAQPGTITGSATICSGTTTPVTYSITAVSGATSYTWTLPTGWTGTSTTNSINSTFGAAGGNISVAANNTCGTSAARTLAVTITSAPKPTFTIDLTNPGTPVLISSASSGNQWYLNGTAIAGATNAAHTATSAGVYKVQVKVGDCLSAFSDEQSFIVTGDLARTTTSVEIYPNPVSEWLTVSLGAGLGTKEVALFDLNGKKTDSQNTSGSELKFHVVEYSAGVYIVKVKTEEAVKVMRFVKR
jgi:uncharacterized delta-60 repeat protein